MEPEDSNNNIDARMMQSGDGGDPQFKPRRGFADPSPEESFPQALVEDYDNIDDAYAENQKYRSLVDNIYSKFTRAKQERQPKERVWIQAYNNIMGRYNASTQFTDTEKSQAFVKITKTKVLASYGKLVKTLLSGKRYPIGVDHTPVPEGIPLAVHMKLGDSAEKGGKSDAESGKDKTDQMPTYIADKSVWEKIKPSLKKKFEGLEKPEDKLKEGYGTTDDTITFEPARAAAKKLDQKIQDYLVETKAEIATKSSLLEMTAFGTGIIKGPLVISKEFKKWDKEGTYAPIFKDIADISHTSIWNNYPDYEARSSNECEWWIERHRMTKTQMRDLGRRPMFREQSIEKAIEMGADYNSEYFEEILRIDAMDEILSNTRYEVLEYWGVIDMKDIEHTEFYEELDDKLKKRRQININAWICNSQVLRLVINPFTPMRIPYYACPYEIDPYSIWGVGVAENMFTEQLVMNGFFRLGIDNAVLSSNLMFELDESLLLPGQDLRTYPGKVFRRTGGQAGQSIYPIKFPNVTQEVMLLFDKARQLADEATGIPSYSHGVSGIMSTGRTASGMSMLIEAAGEVTETVIGNTDAYWFKPMGEDLHAFIMQFDFDEELQGDLSIVALGTKFLTDKEKKAEKLMQILQLTGNELYAPYIKVDAIIRELIETELDVPERYVNDQREALIQAEVMKKMKEAQGIPSDQPAQGPGGIPGVPGMVQAGGSQPAMPGDPQFTQGAAPPPNLGQQQPQQPAAAPMAQAV